MQVLRLVQQHNWTIPHQLGKELGSGADGQAFEIIGSNKVIKICGLFALPNHDLRQEYLQRLQVLDYLLYDPSPIHAGLYEHGRLGDGDRLLFGNQSQRYILYYYVMERLTKLSEDEKKVFHSILSHED